MKIQFSENDTTKIVRSESYNYNFNKVNGQFARWGKTYLEDPIMAPFPEIMDIEVSEICNGVPDKSGIEKPCRFCYKSNTRSGRNMSLSLFKKIIDKTLIDGKHSFLTQIAFGADAKAKSNPELFDMMNYAKSKGIISNITVANLDEITAKRLSMSCGAVSVSRYENKDICYDSVKRLTDNGLKQVNIHVMLSVETISLVKETLRDYKTDSRLEKLNAIVILSLKKKGRGACYSQVSQDQFKELVDYSMSNSIPIGFDSCSFPKFEYSVRNDPNYKELMMMSEPCESTLFSQYVNVEGKFYSCSFCENSESFPIGLDIANCNDFIKDMWFHPTTVLWRNTLLAKRKQNDFSCPVYEV